MLVTKKIEVEKSEKVFEFQRVPAETKKMGKLDHHAEGSGKLCLLR